MRIAKTKIALALGMLMDKYNPFRVLAVSYALGAVCIVMIGLSENGLWLMALAIFGTGIGISGSQVGLNIRHKAGRRASAGLMRWGAAARLSARFLAA